MNMIKSNEDVLTSIGGMVKNVGIPVSQAEKALKSGIAFDGSSIEGFVRIEESDMMICDVYRPDGKPFEGDPRYVLKRAIQEEFFFFEHNLIQVK